MKQRGTVKCIMSEFRTSNSALLKTQLETLLEAQLRQEHSSNKILKTRVDELEQQLQSIQQDNTIDEFKHEFSLLV